MSWFSRKPTQQKYIEAAVTVASNLFLHTIPGAEDAPAPLQFGLPDSRYRYMLFCLSAVAAAALAYDEKKHIQPQVLMEGCLQFARWIASENAQEYFDDPTRSQESIDTAKAYLQELLKSWGRWAELEKRGEHVESIELILHMVRTTESHLPADTADIQRLGSLALSIACRLQTMRGALIELASR
ncbi:MAG: hypothetical protein NTV08_07740 [Verrucomicrobia bacterium]|nr:hypothetical protein [Verrucomicrobiota bacterium]